jgi:hypothetical protein
MKTETMLAMSASINMTPLTPSGVASESPFWEKVISISLSNDGKKVAIGANRRGDGGQVRLFEYDKDNTYWRQVGAAIEGEAMGAGFGASVSLVDVSGGIKLAVGAPDTVQESILGLVRELVGEAFVFQEISSE